MKYRCLIPFVCAVALAGCNLDAAPEPPLRGTFAMVHYNGSPLPTVAYDFPRHDRWGQPIEQHCSAMLEAGELEVMVHPPWAHIDERLINSCTGAHIRTTRFSGHYAQTGATFTVTTRREPDEPIVLHGRIEPTRIVITGYSSGELVFAR
jgi:hypothetical protein